MNKSTFFKFESYKVYALLGGLFFILALFIGVSIYRSATSSWEAKCNATYGENEWNVTNINIGFAEGWNCVPKTNYSLENYTNIQWVRTG